MRFAPALYSGCDQGCFSVTKLSCTTLPPNRQHALPEEMTMNRLQAMATFACIVETRSFTRAAESLSVPRSSVTTTLKQLEAHLGTPLLRRGTRSLNLTEPGRSTTSAAARSSPTSRQRSGDRSSAEAPKGRVRVDMPGALARAVLVPRLTEFERQYPDIELILGLSDRPADLIYDGIDCAIRPGELSDSALVARRIGLLQWITCASPLYLKTHGEPRSVQDLSAHLAVNYRQARRAARSIGGSTSTERRSACRWRAAFPSTRPKPTFTARSKDLSMVHVRAGS